jgi:4'-phosphopantetheinyl transferase
LNQIETDKSETELKWQWATPVRDVIEVEIASLDVGSGTVQYLESLLSTQELNRADRFALDRERRRFIVARATLRRMLGQRLQIRPEKIELAYRTRGKPALAPSLANSGLRFNVSHHGEFAVYAFALGHEVGIDVEEIRDIPDADGIVGLVFSQREREMYDALDAPDKPRGFFNCWTRKEAFIKALGTGLSYPLDSFAVSLAPDEPARFIHINGAPGIDCGWTLHAFEPQPGLIGALVAPHDADLRVSFRRMNGSQSPGQGQNRHDC